MKSKIKEETALFRRYIAVHAEYLRLVTLSTITEEEFTLWLGDLKKYQDTLESYSQSKSYTNP